MTVSGGAAPRSAPEPPSAGADPAQALGKLGRSWTWMLGSALTAFVPGVLILVWPDETLHVLGVLVGLYLLVMGGFRFVASFAREDLGERLPGLLLAVLYVLAGVLCMRNPLQTVAALSLIVGVVWLVSGILTLYTAIVAGDLPHRGFLLGAAVIGILAGIVVLALPTESARALTRLLGLWLVLLALVEVVVAIAWRAAVKRGAAAGAYGAEGPYGSAGSAGPAASGVSAGPTSPGASASSGGSAGSAGPTASGGSAGSGASAGSAALPGAGGTSGPADPTDPTRPTSPTGSAGSARHAAPSGSPGSADPPDPADPADPARHSGAANRSGPAGTG